MLYETPQSYRNGVRSKKYCEEAVKTKQNFPFLSVKLFLTLNFPFPTIFIACCFSAFLHQMVYCHARRLHSWYNDFDFIYCFLSSSPTMGEVKKQANHKAMLWAFLSFLLNANSDSKLYRKTILYFKRIFYRFASFSIRIKIYSNFQSSDLRANSFSLWV